MDIYLPLAETSANLIVLLLIGGGVGVLSGMFGVGGGFLLTPLLTLVGIPPGIAVATGANQIIASSVSGVLVHLSRNRVDIELAAILAGGGLAGSGVGVIVFSALRTAGQLDFVVQLLFVFLLGGVGLLMLIDSYRARRNTKVTEAGKRPLAEAMRRLPFKRRFEKSDTEISVILPVILGIGIGFLTAMMGVGGGFLAIPAMIYILGLPGQVVVGTSLLQMALTSAVTTLLQAGNTQSVDVVLAFALIVSGVGGAQLGARFTLKLDPNLIRLGLAVLIVAVAITVALRLVIPPTEPFSLG
ncbi:MAG: sulfite exporter TauE/SafE family protein [Rhodobacteraceae bacterium]|nr:sulfite exporter TauE/SafE family protein [Paracoccaceae bacterium]